MRQDGVSPLPSRAGRVLTGRMSDLIFIALTVGFFLLAVGLVRLCDGVIGPEDAER